MNRHNLNFLYTILTKCSKFKIKSINAEQRYNTVTTLTTVNKESMKPLMRLEKMYSQNVNKCWNCNSTIALTHEISFTCSKCGSLRELPKSAVGH